MLKQRKNFKIRCFYCKKLFVYTVDFACYIKRAYCEKCKKKHIVNKFKKGAEYSQYKEYLAGVRNQLGEGKGETPKIVLARRGAELFRGDINLGKIVSEDRLFVSVQKFIGGTASFYRKEFIIEY